MAGDVAAFDIPASVNRDHDFEVLVAFDAVEETADPFGRVIAGLAFDDPDLHRFAAVAFRSVFADVVGAIALGIADDTVDRGREVADVGVDMKTAMPLSTARFTSGAAAASSWVEG